VRRLELRTDHGDAETARALAAALTPDNTAAMETRVEEGTLVTTVERETTGGVRATADDYVVNLRTAAQLTDDSDTPTHDT
jgi:hypothetical protein